MQRPAMLRAAMFVAFGVSASGHAQIPAGIDTTFPITPQERLTGRPAEYTVTDVSPDTPFGVESAGPNTGGLVRTVVCDPRNPAVVYAGALLSGVWKSVDGGRSWTQRAAGLRFSRTAWVGPAIACDPNRPNRLIYATEADPLRDYSDPLRPPADGLYISNDGAVTWSRWSLRLAIPGPVAFGRDISGESRAMVLTSTGMYISTDPDLQLWRAVPNPVPGPGENPVRPAYFAVEGDLVYACAGRLVYQSRVDALLDAGNRQPWTSARSRGLELPPGDDCYRVAVAPERPFAGGPKPVLVYHMRGGEIRVSRLNFTNQTATDLGFNRRPGGDSGSAVLATARPVSSIGDDGPGRSYEVFVSDFLHFYRLLPSGEWSVVPGVHVDTWAIAVPQDYDPSRGRWSIFAAHDGGVSLRTAESTWVCAMAGLHAYNSGVMAGISRANPVLYVPSGHNNCFASANGGASWEPIGNLGDIGTALLDPIGPIGRVALVRNEWLQIHSSAEPYTTPALPGAPGQPGATATHAAAPGVNTDVQILDGAEPGNACVSQIMTMPGENSAPKGDYVAVRNGNTLVRTRDAGETRWVSISEPFPQPIVAVQTSGGHRAPVVYVQLEDGTLRRGVVDRATGSMGQGRQIAGRGVPAQAPQAPFNPIAHPYKPMVLYVSDRASRSVMVTNDGGGSWQVEPDLTAMATNRGEFLFDFNGWPSELAKFAPLHDMVFDHLDLDLRVALMLSGAVAVSRQGGGPGGWVRIDQNLRGTGELADVRRLSDLAAIPYSGFMSTYGGRYRLYLAMAGRGVVCIDGPFTGP